MNKCEMSRVCSSFSDSSAATLGHNQEEPNVLNLSSATQTQPPHPPLPHSHRRDVGAKLLAVLEAGLGQGDVKSDVLHEVRGTGRSSGRRSGSGSLASIHLFNK